MASNASSEESSKEESSLPMIVIVSGAGAQAVNGIYHRCEGYFQNAVRFNRFGKYKNREVLFSIFKCNVSNNSKHWYISIVPNTNNNNKEKKGQKQQRMQPGTSADLDFYSVPVSTTTTTQNGTTSKQVLPPSTGWTKSIYGQFPSPMLSFKQDFIESSTSSSPSSQQRSSNMKKMNVICLQYQRWMKEAKQNGYNFLKNAPKEARSDKGIVLTAVTKYGMALQHTTTQLQNDKQIVKAAIQQNCWAFQYASPELRNNKEIVLYALQQQDNNNITKNNGNIHQSGDDIASSSSSSHRRFSSQSSFSSRRSSATTTMATMVPPTAMTSSRKHLSPSPSASSSSSIDDDCLLLRDALLKFASKTLQNDKDVIYQYWLFKVRKNGWTLKNAPKELQDDKLIVSSAVQQDGLALEYSSERLQGDRHIVTLAFQQNRYSLQYACKDLSKDKAFILKLVKTAGRYAPIVLQWSDEDLKKDKDIIIAAVRSDLESLKFAHEDIKRDPDVLVAASMFDEHHHEHFNTNTDQRQEKNSASMNFTPTTSSCTSNTSSPVDITTKKIALSTRFSLDQKSTSDATRFTKLFKDHPYIGNSHNSNNFFKVYAPNAFDKETCDPKWTRFNHPCRGTSETCQFDNVLTEAGRPTNKCCWRYSFRFQLQEAKESCGFMLQVIEKDSMGNGQRIERDMALAVGTKIFQVHRPRLKRIEYCFGMGHIEEVVTAIKDWYDTGCEDMSECIIRPKVLL